MGVLSYEYKIDRHNTSCDLRGKILLPRPHSHPPTPHLPPPHPAVQGQLRPRCRLALPETDAGSLAAS